MKLLKSLVIAAALLSVAACNSMSAAPSAAAPAAKFVSFIEPVDGATVTSPFVVKFGVAGMQVQPAGIMAADTGHHHLLINADDIPAMASIPADEKHMHFGKGQTETTLNLAPGKYKLTMQFGNGVHQAYGPTMNKTINITVK